MECKECMGDLVYDEVGRTYYCPTCHILYDEEDFKEEIDSNESNEWEPEDLNGLSLVVLHLLMCIPIVSIFIPILVGNSNVKSEYNKSFAYRFLSQVIILIGALLVYVLVLNSQIQEVSNAVSNTMDAVSSYMLGQSKAIRSKIEVPATKYTNVSDLIPITNEGNEKSTEELLTPEEVRYLSNTILAGKDALNLAESIETKQCAILVQSADVAERHGSNSYRNVGYVLKGAKTDSSGKSATYYVDINELSDFYTDDYGELIRCSIDDIKNNRYIFYLNPKKYYSVIPLYGLNDTVLGIAFKEVTIV